MINTLRTAKKILPDIEVQVLIVTNELEAERTELINNLKKSSCYGCNFAVVLNEPVYLEKVNFNIYELIIFDYYLKKTEQIQSPLNQLFWWLESEQKLPLILITDPLGDELAIECIKAGIKEYVLRHKLSYTDSLIDDCLTKINQPAEVSLIPTQDKAKAEFISILTHELRAPLTGILGFSRALIEEIFGSLNPKQKQYVNGILTSGEHLLNLVNDFLDLSKIEADKEELFLERVAVEDVCLASLSMVQERARQENLKLNLDIGKEVDFCWTDQRRLTQILVNLLSNAVKFTPEGSITLKVNTQETWLIIQVIDTGIGIALEQQKNLFQPFTQINSKVSRKYKGTGLGLALSRKLAKLHGGDLTVTSQVGKGSCFTLRIPVRSSAAKEK